MTTIPGKGPSPAGRARYPSTCEVPDGNETSRASACSCIMRGSLFYLTPYANLAVSSAPTALRKECSCVVWSGETTPHNTTTLFASCCIVVRETSCPSRYLTPYANLADSSALTALRKEFRLVVWDGFTIPHN